MAHSLLSMVLLNLILAAMFIVLFSSAVRSKPSCQRACTQFPDYAGHCQSLGYIIGICTIDAVPNNQCPFNTNANKQSIIPRSKCSYPGMRGCVGNPTSSRNKAKL